MWRTSLRPNDKPNCVGRGPILPDRARPYWHRRHPGRTTIRLPARNPKLPARCFRTKRYPSPLLPEQVLPLEASMNHWIDTHKHLRTCTPPHARPVRTHPVPIRLKRSHRGWSTSRLLAMLRGILRQSAGRNPPKTPAFQRLATEQPLSRGPRCQHTRSREATPGRDQTPTPLQLCGNRQPADLPKQNPLRSWSKTLEPKLYRPESRQQSTPRTYPSRTK